MEDLDFATIFEEASNEAEFQKIIKPYKGKIDSKALSAITKAAFEAIIEQKPAEEANDRLMAIIKDYIVPRGKMTLPEYYSLLESIGNIFLKYKQTKNEVISNTKIDQTSSNIRNCPNCGEPIEEQFDECWKCSGEKEGENIHENENFQTPKSKKNKIVKTVFVIVGVLIWWSVVLIKNTSNLGPGITLGRLLQTSVIFIIAFVIVRKIWQKK